jgi:hypothetical protein
MTRKFLSPLTRRRRQSPQLARRLYWLWRDDGYAAGPLPRKLRSWLAGSAIL